jgi:hypothetical protein
MLPWDNIKAEMSVVTQDCSSWDLDSRATLTCDVQWLGTSHDDAAVNYHSSLDAVQLPKLRVNMCSTFVQVWHAETLPSDC